jgi:tetratricopeptide (TPR) repeat protein
MAYSVLPMYAYVASDSVIPSGLAAGQRGIALDPNLSDAHLAYANNLIYGYKWNEAEEHFKRAIALDPRNPTAHQWYGDYLYVIGRVGDAIPELRRATELDPLSAVLQNDLGFALRHAGQYEEATRPLIRSLELDPQFVWARANLAGALLALGRTDSAIAAGATIPTGGGDASVALIKAYLLQNRRADAESVVDSLRKQSMQFKEGGALSLAFVHGAIGNADSALYWLAKAIDHHEGGLFSATVPCDDAFEGIRSDPRFNAQLKRMGAQPCQRQPTH